MDKVNLILGLVVLILGTIQFSLQGDVIRVGWRPLNQCNYLKCDKGYTVSEYKATGAATIAKNSMAWDGDSKKAYYADYIKYTKGTVLNSTIGTLILLAGVFVAFLGILIIVKAIKSEVAHLQTFAWVAFTLAVISGSLSMLDIDVSQYGPSKALADEWNKKWPYTVGPPTTTTGFSYFHQGCYLTYDNIPASTFTDGTTSTFATFAPITDAAAATIFDGDSSKWSKAVCTPSSLYQAINAFSIINGFVMLLLVVWWSCPCTKKPAVKPEGAAAPAVTEEKK